MYIATNEENGSVRSILSVFPTTLKRYMYNINLNEAEEIRLIQGKPIFIHYSDGDYYITPRGVLSKTASNGIKATKNNIDELLERITKSSLYAVKDEIRNGYITIDGGHRVGITGTGVTDGGRVEFIKNISAMNIRLANEMLGVADGIIGEIMSDTIKNTLIVSPPGCGKTTLLRDIIRQISEANHCVGVADERCEIAAMKDGVSSFRLGGHTTVLENCPKTYAMTVLLRSMSPDVIATDELGAKEDFDAVYSVLNSGVSIIATAHGRDVGQLMRREVFKELLPLFDVVIVLSRRNGAGTIEKIIRSDRNA